MEDRTCVTPDCELEVHIRGLCRKHYERAHYYIKTGKTTWEELVCLGLASEKKRVSDHGAWGRMISERRAAASGGGSKDNTE